MNFCPGYLDCPADPNTPCECVALRDPGESVGSGGNGPAPPLPSGPYRLPGN
ncbi:MAG: hypothetical protein QNK04_12665 [Myxococcota bacterium]|nr:hypothetical protein [Myxococcota bacterium]